MRFTRTNFPLYAVYALMLLLFLYTIIRAAILSVTHDEALIYLLTKSRTLSDIFFYKILSQDHMLNTLLMRVFSDVLNPSGFYLRIPNLIGHLLFMGYSYLILKKTINPNILLAGFIILNLNPYMLDFFSIARGYGLSAGLMMASIYYVLKYAQSSKLKDLIFSYLFGALSVLTVVTLLYYFSALVGWTIIYAVVKFFKSDFNDKSFFLRQATVILIAGISLLLLYLLLNEPIQRFTGKSFVQQQYETDFFSRTIRTMVDSAGYHRFSNFGTSLISNLIGFSFLLATILHIYRFIKKGFQNITSPDFILYFFGISIAVISTILHYWFGIRFLDNRFTVFIMPLALLTPIYLLNDLVSLNKSGRKWSLSLCYMFAVVFFLNTITVANFTHYIDWKYDSCTKEMVKEIKALHQRQHKEKISLGISWVFEPAINYYRDIFEMDWVNKVTRIGIENQAYDYYYIKMEDMQSSIFNDCLILKKYPVSQTVLLRRSAND